MGVSLSVSVIVLRVDGLVVNHSVLFMLESSVTFTVVFFVSWYLHYANRILVAWFVNISDISCFESFICLMCYFVRSDDGFYFLYWSVVLLIVNMIWLFMLYKSRSSHLILLLLFQAIYAVICLDASFSINMRNYFIAYFS